MDNQLVLVHTEKLKNLLAAAGEEVLAIDRLSLASAPDLQWDAPVGTAEERASAKLWPGYWVDATGFLAAYTATGKLAYHTGVDLNLNRPFFDSDKNAPVYACASGTVVYANTESPWGDKNAIIVIAHILANGNLVWTRYAHVNEITVLTEASVVRGQQIAKIGNAGGRYPYHLHFDIAKRNLGVAPGDWPGNNRQGVLDGYHDPLEFLKVHHNG